ALRRGLQPVRGLRRARLAGDDDRGRPGRVRGRRSGGRACARPLSPRPPRRAPRRPRRAMLTFGLMIRPGHFPLPHVLATIKVAEAVGFAHVWFGDSHLIWHEVAPYLTAAAMSTTRMRVGPLVSNPVTRHPTVVASMLATVAELFDGRAALGLGRGDSAVRTLGLSPMKLA